MIKALNNRFYVQLEIGLLFLKAIILPFKTLLNPEKYLQVINNYFIRKQLTLFGISNHQLLIEEGRHRGIDPVDRKLKFCDMKCVENEIHFLLVCPLYHNLRL